MMRRILSPFLAMRDLLAEFLDHVDELRELRE